MLTIITVIVAAVILLSLVLLGLRIMGTLIAALFWLFFRVPAALFLWALGIVLCVPIITIPAGAGLFGLGCRVLVPV